MNKTISISYPLGFQSTSMVLDCWICYGIIKIGLIDVRPDSARHYTDCIVITYPIYMLDDRAIMKIYKIKKEIETWNQFQ